MLTSSGPSALRIKIVVDNLGQLRDRLGLENGAGRLAWTGPESLLPQGRTADLEVTVRDHRETLNIRGIVGARREGGVFIDLPELGAVLDGCEPGLCRSSRRIPAEHLALVAAGGGQVLCRMRDLGAGGARLLVSAEDAGQIGDEVKVVVLDSGASGNELEIKGRIAWAGAAEVGVEWSGQSEQIRAALGRVLKASDQPWQLAMVG